MTEAEEIRQLADSLFDGVVQIDNVGRIILWNHGAERITGLPASQLVGKFFQILSQIPYLLNSISISSV